MKLLDTWVGVDQNWFEVRLSEGWDGVIQGAGSGGRAAPLYPTMQAKCRNSLRAVRLAGGLTAAYFNTNPWYSPQQTLDDALRAIGDELEPLTFLVIDHELSPVPATATGAEDLDARTHELIRLTREAAPGIPLIGYSADWFLGFLSKLLGRSARYALDGYWHARYDGVPDLSVRKPTWMMADPLVGKQYKGTTLLGGKVTDLNVFDDAWIAEIIKEEETDMGKILLFGREGQGGGIFDALSGRHLSMDELTTIQREAKANGIEVVQQKLSADDPFFRRGSISFPHGIPTE